MKLNTLKEQALIKLGRLNLSLELYFQLRQEQFELIDNFSGEVLNKEEYPQVLFRMLGRSEDDNAIYISIAGNRMVIFEDSDDDDPYCTVINKKEFTWQTEEEFIQLYNSLHTYAHRLFIDY